MLCYYEKIVALQAINNIHDDIDLDSHVL